MSSKTIIAAVVAMILLTILISFGNVTVWQGHFPLMIVVNQGEALSVDLNTLRFATCWNDIE